MADAAAAAAPDASRHASPWRYYIRW